MRLLLTLALTLAAAPALAAGETFVSLTNTNFIVLIAFLVFLGVLVYFGVPKQLARLLDKRAFDIRSEIEEARGLRDEAQALLASYERRQKDVQEQAGRIVANARDEATRAAEEAKASIATSVDRRMAAAEEQIAQAQAAAVREVRDRAIIVAVAAAREVIASHVSAERADSMIDDSITTVNDKLH